MAQVKNPLLQQLLSPAPAASAASITDSQLQQLIQSLIDVKRTLIERFITLLEAVETHLAAPDRPSLQGETEEILRLIIQGAQKSIEALIAQLETLQTEIIDSFFPTQP